MSRTVMSHLYDAIVEVECLDLAKRSTCPRNVGGELGHGSSQFVLACRRDAPRGEQRSAKNHPGPEAFMQLAAETAVIVGETVEVEVVHQPIEAD
jgi:hypothetical protein